MPVRLAEIRRYPVKSLSAEVLESLRVEPDEPPPGDRRFALLHGSTRFDPMNPEHQPPRNAITLKTEERLAQIKVVFDAESGEMVLYRQGRAVAQGQVDQPLGRTLISQFFAGFLGPGGRGLPKLVEAPPLAFADRPEPFWSIINLASLADLERVARRPLDPARFRANLWLAGLPPWAEFDWIGREIAIAGVRFSVEERIERCAAISVDPESAARDINLPLILRQGFGHLHFGVYAVAREAGCLRAGAPVEPPRRGLS